jgi:flagellar motor switch protein FliN
MFTGVALTAAGESAVVPEAVIWVEQGMTRAGKTGRLWIGVSSPALALVESAASDMEGRLSLLREVADQSVKSLAQALNNGICPGFQCAGDAGSSAPAASVAGAASLVFNAGPLGQFACLLRADADLFALVAGDGPGPLVSDIREAAPVVSAGDPAPFERFAGVELPVSVVLGRATLKVRDVLKLAVGSLIELDTRTTDPVDVCVHDGVVARGEVVSIKGNYGVRILEVTTQRERLSQHLRAPHAVTAGDSGPGQPRVH